MNGMVMQAIIWTVSLGVLVLYMQRRRKRKSDN
jgi:hypothetical protein